MAVQATPEMTAAPVVDRFGAIVLERADGIATITLDRPDRLNAFDDAMKDELIAAFDITDGDDSVRAVIVTGAGRAFCAGADLSAGSKAFVFHEGAEDGPVRPDGTFNYAAEKARDGGGQVSLRIFRSLKPVIGAINGPAVGVGITMTLPMDIRLASRDSRIGFVFARRGMVAEATSTWFLPRVVGISRAMEWCASGRVFNAQEALDAGLVRSLHTPEDLLPAARAIAREIADGTAPVSVALIRQMMWRGVGSAHPMEAHRIESRAILSRGHSPDVAEGVDAFLAKRPAQFPQSVSRDMPDFYPWWDEPEYS